MEQHAAEIHDIAVKICGNTVLHAY